MVRSTLLGVVGAAALLTLPWVSNQIAWGDDAPNASPAAAPDTVEADSVEALGRMGAYLRTLNSFEVSSDTTTDEVADDGQKLQFAGNVVYQVRRPNGFTIATASDRKVRKVYYDGKTLTLWAPRVGFYAKVAAPPTIRETLQEAQDKYGLELPLTDLFRWGTADDRYDDLKSGYRVGYAKVNGVDADQYAFREDGMDWQIWIARGAKPLPLKVVAVTLDDPTQPEFTATLTWKVNAPLTAAAFVFTPPAGAKAITMASSGQ